MVTTQDEQGNKVELTNQKDMEKAILESNHKNSYNLPIPPSTNHLWRKSLVLKALLRHLKLCWQASTIQIMTSIIEKIPITTLTTMKTNFRYQYV